MHSSINAPPGLFLAHHPARRLLVPWPQTKPVPPAVEARSLSPLDHQGSPINVLFFLLLVRASCVDTVIRDHTIETEAVENGISTASLSGFNMSGSTHHSVKGSHHTPYTPEELTFWDNGKGQRSRHWSRELTEVAQIFMLMPRTARWLQWQR